MFAQCDAGKFPFLLFGRPRLYLKRYRQFAANKLHIKRDGASRHHHTHPSQVIFNTPYETIQRLSEAASGQL